MASWTFLTNHARVLLCVAHDPGVRLRDIAASLDITERSAFGIITDLVEAGYVIKEEGRPPQPLPHPGAPPAARSRQPGTHRRRSPGPPGRHRPGRDLKSRPRLPGQDGGRHGRPARRTGGRAARSGQSADGRRLTRRRVAVSVQVCEPACALSHLAGELHGDRTDTARGAVDQDGLARREASVVDQPLPCGQPGDRQRGGHGGRFTYTRTTSDPAKIIAGAGCCPDLPGQLMGAGCSPYPGSRGLPGDVWRRCLRAIRR